jgi:hypothetical protein
MGCACIGISRSTYDFKEQSFVGNPNPMDCEIVDSKQIGKYLIVQVNYPNCKNYEGNKILVYKNIDKQKLLKIKKIYGIDPHFSHKMPEISPIARFTPTEEGWENAIKFCLG